MNNCKAVTSTYHLLVKFPTEYGVGEVQGDQLATRECYLAILAMDEQAQTMKIEERRVVSELAEALEDISLDKDDPKKGTKIGANLEENIKKDLIRFLRENIDVFAWSHEDMLGIDPSVITHRFNIYLSSKPVRQKKRMFAPEKDNAIKEEV